MLLLKHAHTVFLFVLNWNCLRHRRFSSTVFQSPYYIMAANDLQIYKGCGRLLSSMAFCNDYKRGKTTTSPNGAAKQIPIKLPTPFAAFDSVLFYSISFKIRSSVCAPTSHCSLLTLYPDKINIGVTSKSKLSQLNLSIVYQFVIWVSPKSSRLVLGLKLLQQIRLCCMSANVSVHLLLAAHILHSKRLVERTSKLVINVDALIVCMS